MASNTFLCWKCKGTFPKGWSDEEAEAEYKTLWGENLGEEREVLCDDCHNSFMTWYNKQDKGKLSHG